MKVTRTQKLSHPERVKADTIFIIGNGFDRWQGLNTSYADFHAYYLRHRDEILKNLHIPKHDFTCTPHDGSEPWSESWTDVELIFSDPFSPYELDADFWNTFEASLGQIDAQQINYYFGKEPDDLAELDECVQNAKKILTDAFCGWIASIGMEQTDPAYRFGDNCIFVTFNYTDTLQKHLGVKPEQVFHIHGRATDKKSIIFGHNLHPQKPNAQLLHMGGRFRGLYHIEKLLYETDKHCQDNIQSLIQFLTLCGVMCDEVKDIYVLGQSMGPVDLEYFDFLVRATKCAQQETNLGEDASVKDDDIDEFALMQYVIDTVGYGRETTEEAESAMMMQRRKEQAARNCAFQREFAKKLGRKAYSALTQAPAQPRTQDAKWHISYYGEQDRIWKESVLKELHCENYELLDSIDECLHPWKKSPTESGEDYNPAGDPVVSVKK